MLTVSAAVNKGKAGNVGRLHERGGLPFAAQEIENAWLIFVTHQTMHAGAASIGIDQNDAQAAPSQKARQVHGDGGFPFTRAGAGEEKSLGPLLLEGGEQQSRAQMPVRFDVGPAGV